MPACNLAGYACCIAMESEVLCYLLMCLIERHETVLLLGNVDHVAILLR